MVASPHFVFSPCHPKKGRLHAFDAKQAINYKQSIESFGNLDVLLILDRNPKLGGEGDLGW